MGCEGIRDSKEDFQVSDPSLWKDGCFLYWRGEDSAGRSVRNIQTLAMDTLSRDILLGQAAVSRGQQSRVQERSGRVCTSGDRLGFDEVARSGTQTERQCTDWGCGTRVRRDQQKRAGAAEAEE